MEKIPYAGWPNCIRLSNGKMELIATTDVGPRIIRLGFVGGKNLFKEFETETGKTGGDKWRSYGGHRLWHAPEVKPWTYAPDNSPVDFNWDGIRLKLIQAVEISTGIQKELEVTLGSRNNQVDVMHRLRNKNMRAVELSPWALTVMQGPGRAILPQEPASNGLLPVRPLTLWGYTAMQDKRWNWGRKYIQLQCDPEAKTPQKFGSGNTLGWAAYCTRAEVFIKRFGFKVGAVYPDYGCNNEAYTRGDMLEVESLGPLTSLKPNGQVEHLEQWFLFKAELPIDEMRLFPRLQKLVRKTHQSHQSQR
jgi:hypothetical protein